MVTNRKILFGTLIALVFIGIGTIGYAVIEDFTPLEAFYMTVITISTVGFGEIHTLSEAGRLFTIFLILFGFGSIGFLAHAFTEAIVERAASNNPRIRTMQKRIDRLRNHVIICGYGRVGAATAAHLTTANREFVVIENAEEQIRRIDAGGYCYLNGDATREETLIAAGIKHARALLALLDSDPDNLFAVLTARDLNPTLQIIARSEVTTSESRMLRAGADSIISPHASAGRSVAHKVLNEAEVMVNPTGEPCRNHTSWQDVTPQSGLAGHAVEGAEEIMEAKILGIRRFEKDLLLPDPEVVLELGDQLLLGPAASDPRPANRPLARKLVLVDDNPVIRRLYTRLFQKAGYHLLTAADAVAGYELITREHPDAAIIDSGLPNGAGLELCAALRDNEELAQLRLFVFTADPAILPEQEATRLAIDMVVVKSPDAGEIVEAVDRTLASTRERPGAVADN